MPCMYYVLLAQHPVTPGALGHNSFVVRLHVLAFVCVPLNFPFLLNAPHLTLRPPRLDRDAKNMLSYGQASSPARRRIWWVSFWTNFPPSSPLPTYFHPTRRLCTLRPASFSLSTDVRDTLPFAGFVARIYTHWLAACRRRSQAGRESDDDEKSHW